MLLPGFPVRAEKFLEEKQNLIKKKERLYRGQRIHQGVRKQLPLRKEVKEDLRQSRYEGQHSAPA